MKKILITLLVIIPMSLAGCTASNKTDVDTQTSAMNELENDMYKFFPEDGYFTAELFYEYVETNEGILNPDGTGQSYILDLRSEEEYNEGHIYGAVNLDEEACKDLPSKLYTDYHVFVIGEETEAKQVAELFKETHNAVHLIQGGYASLLEMDGMGKYITTEKFELTHVRSDDRDMIKSKE